MTTAAERFPYLERTSSSGSLIRMPYLPLTLSLGKSSLAVEGLLDTGATINALPRSVGERLGAVWDQQTVSMQLTGNLAATGARALVVMATVGTFAPVRLAFAWAETDAVPVILGQVNFFAEFDVCFYRSQFFSEVRPR
jgi:hypothetical protein